MSDREVELGGLESEIAARAVRPQPDPALSMPGGMTNSLTTKMHRQAVKLLRNREFRAAATLFEFALSQNPHDGAAANNLGFCTIPESPERALAHLEHAENLSYGHTFINCYNRALCLSLLNEHQRALNAIEESWDEDEPSEQATLWHVSDGELALNEAVDVKHEIAMLAVNLSRQLGLQSEAEKWLSLAA